MGKIVATLSVAPDPVESGELWTATGSGYDPDSPVHVNLADPHPWAFFSVDPDEDGNIRFSRPAGVTGVYEVRTMQRRRNGRLVILATDFFEVTG